MDMDKSIFTMYDFIIQYVKSLTAYRNLLIFFLKYSPFFINKTIYPILSANDGKKSPAPQA